MIVWICAEETKEMEEKEFFDYIDNVIKKSPNRLNSISDLIMGAYRNDKAVLDYVLLYTKEQDFDWFDILETSLLRPLRGGLPFQVDPNLEIVYYILKHKKICLEDRMVRVLSLFLEHLTGNLHDFLRALAGSR